MIGIIIPTLNRSEFLIRQLDYYAKVKCPYTIYIGDSSDDYHAERIRQAINKFGNKIEIAYYECLGLSAEQATSKLIENIKEKYCAFIGDDDFLIPNSLSKCAEFLENNLEYRTAQGCGIMFSLEQSGSYGRLKGISTYWKRKEAEENNPTRRLANFSSNYWVPFFSLHRTKEFYEDFENFEVLSDRSFRELMPSHLTIIRGKSKFLNCLYLIRQVHDRRYILPRLFNWLTGPNWQPSFQLFHDTLRDALMEKEKIDQDTASKTVNLAFEQYLRKAFAIKKPRQDKSDMEFVIKIARQIPGLKRAYHLAKSRRLIYRIEINLQRILNPSSPYHKDFMPVYGAITNPPTN